MSLEGSALIKFEKFGEFVLKFIEIIRPKFYNRITWVVVTAGLALMATPLLDKVISVALERAFEIQVTGEDDVVWGFSLVVVALIYHLLTTSLYQLVDRNEKIAIRNRHLEHDKAKFEKANGLMNEEFLSGFLMLLGNDHSYYMSSTSKLQEFCIFLDRDENQFLSEALVDVVKSFNDAAVVFLSFSSNKFFVFPNHQTGDNLRLCVVPRLNLDREGSGAPEQRKKYDDLTIELESLIDDLRSKYRAYRAEIKRVLVV